MGTMQLAALPAFTDNYIWLLSDGRDAVAVDPGDDAPLRKALQASGLRLCGILVTHHHGDHVGGVAALRDVLQGPVWGPASERLPVPVQPLRAGDRIEVLGHAVQVLDVPGHTAGHIAFHAQWDELGPVLFCGDTLFSAGCGRLFEGTPQQMHASLQQLAALPDETLVCCAHEYTLSNLRFAAAVEPGNEDVVSYRQWCESARAAGRPTLPSRIGLERSINPFLRCDVPAVIEAARAQGAADDSGPEVFAALRRWKDRF